MATSILTGSWDASVRHWDVATGEMVRVMHGHQRNVLCIAFHQGRCFSGGSDNVCLEWDAASGVVQHRYEHTSWVSAVLCVPPVSAWNPPRLLTAAQDVIRVWDIATHSVLRCFAGPPGRVTSMALMPPQPWGSPPAGPSIVVGSSTNGASMMGSAAHWCIEGDQDCASHEHVVCDGCDSGSLAQRHKSTTALNYDLCGACHAQLSPGEQQGYVRVQASGVRFLPGHSAPVRHVAVLGSAVFTVSSDGGVRCFRVDADGCSTSLHTFMVQDPRACQASEDGHLYVAAQDGHGGCIAWHCAQPWWVHRMALGTAMAGA